MLTEMLSVFRSIIVVYIESQRLHLRALQERRLSFHQREALEGSMVSAQLVNYHVAKPSKECVDSLLIL